MPAFDAVLDLDVASLPPGVVPDVAMTAVTDAVRQLPGASRVRVRVRAAPAPVVARLFPAGSSETGSGELWRRLHERAIEAAGQAMLDLPAVPDKVARPVPTPVAPPILAAAPTPLRAPAAASGFAEAPVASYVDALAQLASLAQSVMSQDAAPHGIQAHGIREQGIAVQGIAARGIEAHLAVPGHDTAGIARAPRARALRARTSPQSAPASAADVDRVARLLGFVLPNQDRATATAAVQRFGSFAAVLAAPALELSRVPGLGPHSVAAIKLVHAAAIRLARAGVTGQPVLADTDRLTAYLFAALARERVEQFRILFLDERGMLRADEVQATGTVNHTPVYPREVVRRALELGAASLVLVHNHPSGDPTPSQDDIDMTRQIGEAADALSIELRDHIIVGNGRYLSFREDGLLD